MARYIPDFRQGDTFRLAIQYPEDTDLTGYTHWLTLRTAFDAEEAVLEVESLFGEHTADADNIAYLEALPEATALIAPRKYFYDVQAKAPNGDIITLVPPVEHYKDQVFVAPQVTEAG